MSSDRQPKYRQEIQQVSGPVSGYSIPFVNKVNASVSVLELVVSLVFEYWCCRGLVSGLWCCAGQLSGRQHPSSDSRGRNPLALDGFEAYRSWHACVLVHSIVVDEPYVFRGSAYAWRKEDKKVRCD